MKEPYYIFIAYVVGFFVAQILKFILTLLKKENRGRKWTRKELWWVLTCPGGVPSGHATTMSAATTVALFGTLSNGALGVWPGGFNLSGSEATALFILLCVDITVFYDAVHVRWAVGEQGKALNKILEKDGQSPVKVVEGHTLSQVVVGVILGVIVGWLTLCVAGKLGMPMPWYGV